MLITACLHFAGSNIALTTAGFNEGRPHTDLGLIGGLGYWVSGRMKAGIRYLHGTEPLGREILQMEGSRLVRVTGSFYHNRVLQMSLAYRII